MEKSAANDNRAGSFEHLLTTTASEDFKKNIMSRKRYVDKTEILIPLLRGDHETTFFLRPRRFGKTLTLSMIRYFVEDTCDEIVNAENRSLFQGMHILSADAAFTGQMCSYPVINLTFQGIRGDSWETAYASLVSAIYTEYDRHRYLLKSDRISPEQKEYYHHILQSINQRAGESLPVSDLVVSLLRLSRYLTMFHGHKTVVLLDEYDVPLEKAYQGGYYKKMINVISPLLQNVLKTNSENLQFAVVTGCLRIAKESIYTGLNNPEINTVLSDGMSDAIGFTEDETRQLLSDSGFPDHFEEVRSWYDGYHFGQSKIYNPWSVLKHIEALAVRADAAPGTYWAGTSENAIIRELAANGSYEVKEKVEAAMRGEAITFQSRDNIVYAELDYHDDNVFNVMLHSGYLTAISHDSRTITAVIPNREVHEIFEKQIREWFDAHIKSFDVRHLYDAMKSGDVTRFREILVEQYLASMSYYDTQEAYYHGVLFALLSQNAAFRVTSNRESGKGRFDLQCAERVRQNHAFILEVKVSKTARSMAKDAERGARQAKTKKYALEAVKDGYKSVKTYGIAFFQKDCRICAGENWPQP